MRYCRTCLVQALPFSLNQMNAVAKYGPFADQVVMIVNIEITGAIRKQFAHPCYFVGVFRNMRLHMRLREFPP